MSHLTILEREKIFKLRIEGKSLSEIGTAHPTGLSYDEPYTVYKGAGLEQKALIPKPNQTELRSLESEQAGKNQTVKPHQLVLLDIAGNPYPKNADQFLAQFKPNLSDTRSTKLFEQVKQKYNL